MKLGSRDKSFKLAPMSSIYAHIGDKSAVCDHPIANESTHGTVCEDRSHARKGLRCSPLSTSRLLMLGAVGAVSEIVFCANVLPTRMSLFNNGADAIIWTASSSESN